MNLPELPSQAMYDDQDRDLIRRQLIGYMDQYHIGTPTLQARVAEATDRSLDEVNNKTLQRFLAGTHRTNDSFVWLCHKFTLTIDAVDPVKEFGKAVCRFYAPAGEGLPGSLEGGYDVATFRYNGAGQLTDQVQKRYARFRFETVGEENYLRASEESYRTRATSKSVAADKTIRAEGVAFSKSAKLIVLLREALSRSHLTYVLEPDTDAEEARLTGLMTVPRFDGVDCGRPVTHAVRLSPEGEE